MNNSNFISELRVAVVVANYVEENLQLNYLEWMIMLLHYDNVHSNELRIIFCSQWFSSYSVLLQLPANCLTRILSPLCLKSALVFISIENHDRIRRIGNSRITCKLLTGFKSHLSRYWMQRTSLFFIINLKSCMINNLHLCSFKFIQMHMSVGHWEIYPRSAHFMVRFQSQSRISI